MRPYYPVNGRTGPFGPLARAVLGAGRAAVVHAHAFGAGAGRRRTGPARPTEKGLARILQRAEANGIWHRRHTSFSFAEPIRGRQKGTLSGNRERLVGTVA